MAHETVPADIMAAIEAYDEAAQAFGWASDMGVGSEVEETEADRKTARAALDAVILKHLRNADEMKAALERIEQGV